MLENNKKDFIELLLRKKALKFGEFTLPSGNNTPYFFNIGELNTGEDLDLLSIFFSDLIYSKYLINKDHNIIEKPILYGAAYKGIPIASTTATKIYQAHKISLGFTCNRKEQKEHGECGMTMGANIENKEVLILDDVIAEGVTIYKTKKFLNKYGAKIKGIVLALDRQDKVNCNKTAAQKISADLGIPIFSIINFSDILEFTKYNEAFSETYEKLEQFI